MADYTPSRSPAPAQVKGEALRCEVSKSRRNRPRFAAGFLRARALGDTAPQIPVDLGLNSVGWLQACDARAGMQVVGQATLEVLSRPPVTSSCSSGCLPAPLASGALRERLGPPKADPTCTTR